VITVVVVVIVGLGVVGVVAGDVVNVVIDVVDVGGCVGVLVGDCVVMVWVAGAEKVTLNIAVFILPAKSLTSMVSGKVIVVFPYTVVEIVKYTSLS